MITLLHNKEYWANTVVTIYSPEIPLGSTFGRISDYELWDHVSLGLLLSI